MVRYFYDNPLYKNLQMRNWFLCKLKLTQIKDELSVANFGIEMKQAFKMYPRNIVLGIAESKVYAEKKLKDLKNGCDTMITLILLDLV